MSDLLDDVAGYLDTNTAWIAGTDLFAGDMPPTPNDLTAVYEYSGDRPLEVFGAGGAAPVIRPRVQVLTRSGAADPYAAAKARARQAYNLLIAIVNQTVGSSYYSRIAPLQEPFLLQRDENERVVFAFNAEVFREAE